MSYKGKRHSSYGYPKRSSGKTPFRMKKTHKKELFGFPISKDTDVTECSHVPSEINEEGKTGLGVNVGNQIGNIDLSGSKENKRKTKFTAKKRVTTKKRRYV